MKLSIPSAHQLACSMAKYCLLFLLLNLHCILIASKDYCVIGAGPSGLQIGYFLEKSGRDYIIYERDPTPGWFFKIYPRHRDLISINKRHTGKTNKEFNLRHDWNSLLSDNDDLLMTKYSKKFFPPADTFVKYLKDYADTFKLKIQFNTYIKNVTKNEDSLYELTDKNETVYQCGTLIVSTGMWVENVPKNVPGIEHTEGYPTMSIDTDDYEGQTVLIIGRGNSGFETAQHLLGSTNLIHMLSRHRLRLSWETHYVGDVRAVNDGPIDTYQLKSLDGQLEGDLSEVEIVNINGKKYLQFRDDESDSSYLPDNLATREGYDKILRCTGFKFDRSIYSPEVRPNKSPIGAKYPHIYGNYESTKSKGMFFTGVATHSLDWRVSAGGFIHGFRYSTRALARHLEWRNHQVPWPSVVLPNKDLMNYLLKRLNEASGIYQMLSALSDVIIFRDDNKFEYLEEVPIGMMKNFQRNTGHVFSRGIVVNLEYGKNFSGPGSDPFKSERATGDAKYAHQSNFLHPVLYYYNNGIPRFNRELPRPARLHHMVEDFLTEWKAPVAHILPLRWFLEYCTGHDMRKFYAESCFEYAMTCAEPPPMCKEEYLNGFALPKPAIVSA
ncbi:FAD-dependent oxidoreductase domain-containing protein 2-like [Hydractinia symbiolongicarpus]|uniref:FAD-dependent oxidoreductase domain-containing protein 2-like n=1 Tax=Hydractinia symbiolongicarpus TaxID=13093 RepID=UPI00254E88E1|nr:FAD-dependent oxidoreductase domain-containing protein 2-like [Hydractinia symbiolongicarpus]